MMRWTFGAWMVWLLAAGSALAESRSATPLDTEPWRTLPVLDGGRVKPFDTLARETCREMFHHAWIADPETGRRLDAPTAYLALVLDWQGWDRATEPEPEPLPTGHGRASYFRLHQADKWDRSPLLPVDFPPLCRELGLEPGSKYVAPARLSQAKVRVPLATDEKPLLRWAETLRERPPAELTPFEQHSLALAERYWSYQDHRLGNRLLVVPRPGDPQRQWHSLAAIWRMRYDDTSDPGGRLRRVQQAFGDLRSAWQTGSPAACRRASDGFLAAVRQANHRPDVVRRSTALACEAAYNRWAPFRLAWVAMLLAFVGLLASLASGWKPLAAGGRVAFGAGLAAMGAGLGMRLVISGRAPVTNMYESVVFVGFGIGMLGLLLALRKRSRHVLVAAAALTTLTLVLADLGSAVLDPRFRPLPPELRSNFWLVAHVLTITLAYAALAVALGISNITLGYHFRAAADRRTVARLSHLTYRTLQLGVLLLAAGMVLGGFWADHAWGRFWGWDPKEIWALMALLGYVAVLQARFAGWVRHFGLAALAVVCFSLVVMAWYGVNYVLGAGLHTYGFGGGGQGWVLAGVSAQWLYVAAAAVQHARHQGLRQDPGRLSSSASAVA